MRNGFDMRELSRFQRNLLELAENTMPKESKAYLRKEGNKLRKETVAAAKDKTKKKSGNLYKGIKRGKVYKFGINGMLSVRVYGGKPAYHAAAVDKGHRQIDKEGNEVGFVEGKHFFEDAAKDFEETYQQDTQSFIDDLLNRGLR